MNISIYLKHPDVECFNFYNTNLKGLQEQIPDAQITLCRSKEEFLLALPETEIAAIWYFEPQWLPLAPKLRWIVTPAAGKDYFRISDERIRLDYCSFHGEIMAETVIAMMLAEARGIRSAMEWGRTSTWARAEISKHMVPLRGSRVTILGFGHIGTWIAQLAKPFGVKITGLKRNPGEKPAFFGPEDTVMPVSHLKEILPKTDHLVLALPSGDETTDIIGEAELALMPGKGVIYNIGRGNAIEEKALIKALKDGKIQAAYLDVFKEEPLPEDSPLKDCPNLFRMPHISAASPNYMDLFATELAQKYHKKYKISDN